MWRELCGIAFWRFGSVLSSAPEANLVPGYRSVVTGLAAMADRTSQDRSRLPLFFSPQELLNSSRIEANECYDARTRAVCATQWLGSPVRGLLRLAIISFGFLRANDSEASAHRRYNQRPSPRGVLCLSLPASTHPPTTTTMPATVRSRAPVKKALCIGIEYRELAEQFPQLHLPAAHKDPVIMAKLLQGGSRRTVSTKYF